MDLEGDLRRFWLFLRFVPGFVRGPAALSEDFAPGPEDRSSGFRFRPLREGRWLLGKKSGDLAAAGLAPLRVEFKNLWRDFRKVVDYIQRNEKWLLPMFE